jgi:ribosomal protein S27AE
MKKAIHARKPWIVDGKKEGECIGEPWCGAKSTRTDTKDRVTCGRCIQIITKRIGIPR